MTVEYLEIEMKNLYNGYMSSTVYVFNLIPSGKFSIKFPVTNFYRKKILISPNYILIILFA